MRYLSLLWIFFVSLHFCTMKSSWRNKRYWIEYSKMIKLVLLYFLYESYYLINNILVVFFILLIRFFTCILIVLSIVYFLNVLTSFFIVNTLITNIIFVKFITIFFKFDIQFALFALNIKFSISYSLVARLLLFFTNKY